MLLRTEKLSKHFGGLKAVDRIDFELEEGEVRGLIGPNGSGKSTFFNLVSGIYRPDEGSRVWIDEQETTGFEPHRIAALGVARTFQLLRVFSEMTVLENLLVGHHNHVNYPVVAAMVGTRGVRAEEKRVREAMMELLAFIGLADFADMLASELSVGQRRLLALGRAMAMRPRLLLLDERALLALMENKSPGRFEALFARQGAAQRARLRSWGMRDVVPGVRGRKFFLHGREDPFIPPSESVLLASRARETSGGEASVFVFGGFRHVGIEADLFSLAQDSGWRRVFWVSYPPS